MRLTGSAITLKVAVVAFPVGRGHQHADIAAEDVIDAVAESLHARGIETLHDPLLIDDHDGVGRAFQNQAKLLALFGEFQFLLGS